MRAREESQRGPGALLRRPPVRSYYALMSEDSPAVDPTAPTAFGLEAGAIVLGQYELERRLGAGGMGEVWLARDKHLERSVAVKLLPAVLATSARAAEALRSEAAQAIELSHRAIARVYHYGQHDDLPVLVMEYVEGESLAQHLDSHRTLEPARVVELLAPIADALDYAHEKKVVHRDLKPPNIMLRANGSPVLMDFGLAAEARDQSSIQGKTGENEISGTLLYMSPEQIKGKRPRREMDLYSLAATAYEMLCGNPPFFRGDTAAIYQQIIHEPIEPIERWGSALDRVLERGLAKQPQDRFETAGEFVQALGEAAHGTATAAADAAPPSPDAKTVVGVSVPPARGKASKAATVVKGEPPAASGSETVALDGPPAEGSPRTTRARWAGYAGAVLLSVGVVAMLASGPTKPSEPTAPRVSLPEVATGTAAEGEIVVVPQRGPRVFPASKVGLFVYEHDGSTRGNGTGVVVRVGATGVVLTAHHLFGPSGGLKRQLDVLGTLPLTSRARLVQGGQPRRLSGFLRIPGAEAISGVEVDPLDVAAFHLKGELGGLLLVEQEPPEGAVFHVLMHDGTTYEARHRIADGLPARTYVFAGEAPPPGSSGAPVLDEKDRIVGLHLANFVHEGRHHGACTRGERILEHLEKALEANPKSGRSSRYVPFE